MNEPSRAMNFLRWFDPRHRQLGTIAFILNRITGLGLTLYLFLHLYMLSKLVIGEAAYTAFIQFASTPAVKIGEMLVLAAGMIHGLNGIRIGMTSFGVGVRIQKQMFIGLMFFAVLGIGYFAFRMFLGA
jgi:succinate dehydrogenase / fumarate reductase, cytochrome b subunit